MTNAELKQKLDHLITLQIEASPLMEALGVFLVEKDELMVREEDMAKMIASGWFPKENIRITELDDGGNVVEVRYGGTNLFSSSKEGREWI